MAFWYLFELRRSIASLIFSPQPTPRSRRAKGLIPLRPFAPFVLKESQRRFPPSPHKSTALHQIAALLRPIWAGRVESIFVTEVAVKNSRFQSSQTEPMDAGDCRRCTSIVLT